MKRKTEQPNFILVKKIEISPGVYMDEAVYEKRKAFMDMVADSIQISGVPKGIADNMKHDLLLKGRYEGPIK